MNRENEMTIIYHPENNDDGDNNNDDNNNDDGDNGDDDWNAILMRMPHIVTCSMHRYIEEIPVAR